jgi:hypothetical protein
MSVGEHLGQNSADLPNRRNVDYLEGHRRFGCYKRAEVCLGSGRLWLTWEIELISMLRGFVLW